MELTMLIVISSLWFSSIFLIRNYLMACKGNNQMKILPGCRIQLRILFQPKSIFSICMIFMFRVYPKEKTYRDLALYYNIKVFDWINYDHLEIKQNFRVEELWVMASKSKLYFQELLIIFEFLSLFFLNVNNRNFSLN